MHARARNDGEGAKPSSLSNPHAEAARLLALLEDFTSQALRTLRARCEIEGRLDSALLDEQQLLSYELAFCVAETSAASAMLGYSDSVGSRDSLVPLVVDAFLAETLQSALNRLTRFAPELGIDRRDLLERSSNPDLQKYLDAHSSSKALSAVGEEIMQRGSARLPSSLDAEKEMVRDTFTRFANTVVMPRAEEIHREDLDIPDEIIQQAADLGCFGTCIPERFGGLMPDDRQDSLGMIVVTEELSRGSLGAAGSLITRPEIAARALLKGGTQEQQQSWLPKLASGEVLCAISITEPNFGSDVAGMTLKASKCAGGWLLNGSKTWSTFAGKSGLLVTLARTNPDPQLGHRGLSMFLIEKPVYSGHAFCHEQDDIGGGKLSGKAIATIGYRGMHSFDLFFEDYFVPDSNLVGEEQGLGNGFYNTMAGFAGGRIQTAARATGLMQAAFERAVAYAGERKVFGKEVGDYQLTRVKLARMLGTLTACREFSYRVAKLMDDGGGQMEASLVKLFSCRAAEWISREAMQIHGGMGYAEESPVSRYFVDARVLSIFEGAEETLALKVIAKDLIAKA